MDEGEELWKREHASLCFLSFLIIIIIAVDLGFEVGSIKDPTPKGKRVKGYIRQGK